jgi:two-component system osmolarity sensor histidine kinase EnvZ
MPGSFFGRSLLILLLPLLLLQVVSAYVFYNRHWEDVGRRLALGLGGEISILVEAIKTYPDGVDRDWIMAQAHRSLSIIASRQVVQVIPSPGSNQPRQTNGAEANPEVFRPLAKTQL